ncbi:MAG TPA: class I SAM-dependent methyltransferase [Blastocatellia bacterium]|nr:class I SAM-dependent methyltransferase [Blastocatellia bacterium]
MIRPLRIYTAEYYQRIHELEEQKYWWSCGMMEIAESVLDKHVGKESGSLILDAGCGTGLFMDSLRRYTTTPIVGVDISGDAIAISRNRPHSAVCQASVAGLPFSDSSFDLITCNDVLHHVYSRKSLVLKELYRILKANGFLYLRCSAKQRFRLNDDPGMDFHRYTLKEVVELAVEAGFERRFSTYVNSFPSMIADLKNLLKPTKGPGNGASIGLSMAVPPPLINSILFRFLKVEAFLIAHSWPIPIGHTIVTLFQKPA